MGILMTMMFCLYRFVAESPILWDAAIVLAMVYAYSSLSIPEYATRVLAFLGRHSFNIFLFHTFIYSYYFHDIIYWSRNPVVTLLTLIVVCCVISAFIEWLKTMLRIDFLTRKII